MGETIKVRWTHDAPTVDIDGERVETGDVAELEPRRAEAHMRQGRCVEADVEPEQAVVPSDYSKLVEVATDVAEYQGDELESKRGEDLADYLVSKGYERGDKWR